MTILKKIAVLFFVFIASQAFAQKVQLDAVLDTSKMRIGEQAKIDIYVTYNSRENIKILWPVIGDTITGKIEVVGVSAIDTTFPDKTNSTKIFQHQQVLISVYDSGYYAMPGFKFVINGDTANPGYTNPLFLEVHTVPTDSSASKLKDIKPPFDEKFNWKWYLDYIYWGIAILVLLIAAILITYYYARKNRQLVSEPEKPKIPAHLIALAALERIKQEQTWREGKIKEYYSSISDTIRAYIEDRFNVHALESTTDEIMMAFRSQVVDKESKDKLQQLLTLSDLVKFAKMTPIEEEHNFTLQNAFDFVNGTKREEEMTEIDPSLIDAASQTNAAMNRANTSNPVIGDIKPGDAEIYMPGLKNVTPEKTEAAYTNENETVLSMERRAAGRKRLRKVAFIGIPALVLALGLFIVAKMFFSEPAGDKDFEKTLNTINRMCPVMLDSETRLDNVTATGDKTVQFNQTLVNVTAEQIDVNMIRDQMEPVIVNQVKTNPQMEEFRAKRATLKFSFNDNAGKFLFSIKVAPEDYSTYY